MEPWIITVIVIAVIVFIGIIILISSARIVRQTDKYIIERLGGYQKTWGVGLHWLVPFFDRVSQVVSMKEQVKDFAPQPVITSDNVTMQIDTVVFFQVTDPKLYAYGVENPIGAIENLSATTLRNIIGEMDLDATLASRDIINAKMRIILDEVTDSWGIKVHRVELKNILPPKDIREAMERQMRAEREKREKILLAEGTKQSVILIAEGNKESSILNAEAEKQIKIRHAEGEATAILSVKKAEAESILLMRQAEAQGLEALKKAQVDENVLKLKSYEAMAKIADGQATKLIIPSDMQNLSSVVATATEVVNITKNKKNKE